MNYLCLAVQRAAAASERGSREQAQEYFQERFGEWAKERLEAEKKKMEGRIRYYDRREEKHKEDPKVTAECTERREAVRKELRRLESQLGEGQGGIQVWNYEEKGQCCFEVPDTSGVREPVLMLSMAKVCRIGSDFQVVEETWTCMVWREAGDEGAAEVRSRIPKDLEERCILLDICRESPETVEQFRKKIKKIGTEARKKFSVSERRGRIL